MSGYDKRVRVGVDADAAVDRAIEKLLELKNTADELDGKKSTITAELKTNSSNPLAIARYKNTHATAIMT